MCKPTNETYANLEKAYNFFNKDLFNNELPPCLITLVRKKNTRGYFWNDKFQNKETKEHSDEIALNPDLFTGRSEEQILSTLVHEMCHLQQQHFGKPSRNAYHNKQWADYMEIVGLMPSTTGEKGGKRTGQKVTHYIEVGGLFAKSYVKLAKKNLDLLKWQGNGNTDTKAKRKSRASKTKFSCPSCGQNAWGKPDLSIKCLPCDVEMLEA